MSAQLPTSVSVLSNKAVCNASIYSRTWTTRSSTEAESRSSVEESSQRKDNRFRETCKQEDRACARAEPIGLGIHGGSKAIVFNGCYYPPSPDSRLYEIFYQSPNGRRDSDDDAASTIGVKASDSPSRWSVIEPSISTRADQGHGEPSWMVSDQLVETTSEETSGVPFEDTESLMEFAYLMKLDEGDQV